MGEYLLPSSKGSDEDLVAACVEQVQSSMSQTRGWTRATLTPAVPAAILSSPLRLKVREALHAVHNDHQSHVTMLFLLPVTTVFQSLSSNLLIPSHQNANSSLRDLVWF